MSQTREKGFSYYFNLNPGSIQGRITLAFMATLSIAALLIWLQFRFTQNIDQKQLHIIQNLKPIQVETIELRELVNMTQSNFIRFLYLREKTYRDLNKESWLVTIPAQKDSLWHYIRLYDDKTVEGLYVVLNEYLGELKQQQQFLERTNSTSLNENVIRQQTEKDLIFAQREFEQTAERLINYVEGEERKMLRQLETQKSWNFRLIILLCLGGFLLAYIIGLLLFARIFKWLRAARDRIRSLSLGEFPPFYPEQKNEFKEIAHSTNRLKDNLQGLEQFSRALSRKEALDTSSFFEEKSPLGQALDELRTSIRKVTEAEATREWASDGLRKFGRILRYNNDDIHKMTKELVRAIISHLEVAQGGIFIYHPAQEEEEDYFEMMASYAYGKERFANKRFSVRDGLIGRVFQEKEKVYLEEIPSNYTLISSGLGEGQPKSLILIPLLNEEQETLGIIELVFTRSIPEYQIEFLEQLSNNIASSLTIMLATKRNQELLLRSQEVSADLRTREEEARENAEKLSQTQKVLNEQLSSTKRENEKLNAVLENILESIIIADSEGRIEVFNQASEELFGWKREEVQGKSIKLLMPKLYAQEHDQYMQEYMETGEKKIIGIGRTLEGRHKNGQSFPIHLAITEVQLDSEKLFTAIIRRLNS